MPEGSKITRRNGCKMDDDLGNDTMGRAGLAPTSEAAGLDSGLLSVGPDVVAVVTVRLTRDPDGDAVLLASTSHRELLPVEHVAAVLHDLAHELLEEAERAELDGETGAGE